MIGIIKRMNKNKYDESIKRQEKVVQDSLIAIESELLGLWYPKETVEKYMNFVYTIGFNHGRKEPTHEKRVQKFLNGNLIEEYPSVSNAANIHRVNKSTISKAALGKFSSGHKAIGYEWYYV